MPVATVRSRDSADVGPVSFSHHTFLRGHPVRRLFSTTFAFLVLAWAAAEVVGAEPTTKTFVYKQSGGEPREIEVYFPAGHDPGKARVPGMILFHGGGWTGGKRSQFSRACEYFASRGLVAATVDY